MTKTISAVLAGILIGAIAMMLAGKLESRRDEGRPPVRDLVERPAMSQASAKKHRDERYVNLSSVEEIMALPSEFSRAEALYALSGRSGSAAVQGLIFEADRIFDDVERARLLGILFSRLTEIDPQSALALVRTERFATVKALERAVWSTWARNDLDDALFAAKAQTSMVEQRASAQSLYAAFGYMGNEITDRIEAELGIGPDRWTRARYLYQLADKSPAEAIEYVNQVDDPSQQREYVYWLAYYLSLSGPEQALRYASLFDNGGFSTYFERTIRNNIASENPRETIERLIASGRNLNSNDEFYTAIRALAKTDTEAATSYFDQIGLGDEKRNIGSAIVAELARRDPEAALEWARKNEFDNYPILHSTVLRVIARQDPQRAIEVALALPDPETTSQLLPQIIGQLADQDPAEAIAYLDELQNPRHRLEASQRLLQTWIRSDPSAAMDWALSQDEDVVPDLLRMSQHQLLENDIDTAIRILPRLDPVVRDQLKLQIAERIAARASPAEAQNFIRQFEGEPGYEQLQATVIRGIAQNDTYAAIQLAAQLPVGRVRDGAYVSIVGQHAQANPVEAIRWLGKIDDEQVRGVAAGQIAVAWHANDPMGADRWITGLSSGPLRDNVISTVATQWHQPGERQQALIDSIEDSDIRGRAKLLLVYRLMQTDPVKARELLDDEDIPQRERQRIDAFLLQNGRGI